MTLLPTSAVPRGECSPSGLSVLLLVLLALGCGDGRITDPDPDPQIDCDSRTETAPQECTTWTPTGGPYELHASITMDTLIIEAGTVVRAAPGVLITVNHLVVNGTADQPVHLLPLGTEPWQGITGPVLQLIPGGNAELRHARIEHTTRALFLSMATIEDTHIVRTQNDAVTLFYGGELTRVAIEQAGRAGVVLYSASRIEDTTIRESGTGIALGLRTVLRIGGGAIEDNEGDGITTLFHPHLGSSVIFEAPVSITHNGGYPLRVPLSSLRGVLSDEAAVQMITGNVRDTIIAFAESTWGASHEGPLILHRTLPVRAYSPTCMSGLMPMTLMPGALFIVEALPCPLNTFGRTLPVMAGTADEPVTMHGGGLTLGIAPADTVWVQHARLHNLNVFSPATTVVMQDVETDSVVLQLEAPGSRLIRVRSVRGGLVPEFGPAHPAITLGSIASMEYTVVESALTDAVRVAGDDVVIRDCTIRGGARHGIHVAEGSVRIERCNLESNAGDGVHNATGNAIDATDNWWGDPAGPLGPAGDGVSANVLYEPFSATPFSAAASGFRLADREAWKFFESQPPAIGRPRPGG